MYLRQFKFTSLSALCSFLILANAQAGLITDPNAPVNYRAQIGSANGVPLVNISAPSSAGVSHNQYQDFDVDQRGLIFNNSTKAGESVLGGSVNANPQLSGKSANIILNEVTGASDSQLGGAMEVFGQRANVIVANPNGVSCDGCGFINTNKATLTTGVPVYNNGQLDFEVREGTVTIGEKGLYGDEGNQRLSQIELVARRLEINGEVVATDHLCALVGNLTYHYSFDAAQPNYTLLPGGVATGEPLAIDASEYGALRAGNIQIMSTDAGAGVKLHGYLGTDAGDLFVQSAGDLSIHNADGGNITLQADGNLDQRWKVHGENVVDIQAQNYSSLENSELTSKESVNVTTTQSQSHQGEVSSDTVQLQSGQDIALQGQLVARETLLLNAGRDIQLKDLEVDARIADIDAAGLLSLENSQLRTIEDLPIDTGSLSLDHASSMDVVENNIAINAASDIDNAGRIYANNLSANVAGLTTNSGEISSAAVLSLNTGELSNQSNGSIQAQGELQLNAGAQGIQSLGQIQTEQALTISSAGNATLGGTVSGQTITAVSQADLAVTGSFTSPGEVNITAQGQLSNRGTIASDLDVNLTAGSMDNQAGGLISSQSVISANVTGLLANNGQLLTQQVLNLTAGSVDNQAQGVIESVLAMNVAVAGTIQNAGNWATQAALTINADSLNSTAGSILADQDINLDIETISNAGILQTAKNLNINDAVTLSNSGTLASGEQLNILNAQTLNNSGQVQANTLLTISAQTLNNQVGGALEAQEGVQIDSGAMSNAGSVDTASELVINTTTLNNQIGGLLNADTSVTITAAQQIDNAGDIGTGNILTITANTLNNEVSGRVVSKGLSSYDINGQLNNSGQIGSLTDLIISSTNLSNNAGGVILTQDNLNIAVQAGLSNHGTIRANNVAADSTTTISAATLANDGGANTQSALIYGANNLSLSTSSSLYNRGEILSGKDLVDTGTIQLTATGSVNNAGGFIQAGKVVFDGAHNLTNAATIRALDVVQLSGTSLTNTSTGLIYTANTTQAGTTDRGLVKLDYTGTVSNQGRIVSAADVDIRGSSVTNNRIMAAGNTLKVNAYAGSLNNVTPTGGAKATLFAGGEQGGGLDLGASGNILNNYGNIEARGSGDSAINAGGTLTNLSRGNRTEAFQRQYADHSYASSNYNGDHAWHVSTLNLYTYEGAPVYTNAAQLYAQGNLTVSAASVVNSASLIESGGNMTLSGQVSNNSSTYQADHYREYFYTERRRLGTNDAQFQAETLARYDKVTAAYQNNLNILRALYQSGNVNTFGYYTLSTTNWRSIIEGDVNAPFYNHQGDGTGVNNYFYYVKVGDAFPTGYAYNYTQQALLSEIASLETKLAGRNSAAREDVRQEAFFWGKSVATDGNFNADPAFLDNFNTANFANQYGAQDNVFHIKTSTGHTFTFGEDPRFYTRSNLGRVNLVGTQGNIHSGANLTIVNSAVSSNQGVLSATGTLSVGSLAADNESSGQGNTKSTNQLTSLQGNVSAANAAAVQAIDVPDETDSAFINGYTDQNIVAGTPSTPDPIIDLSQYITDAHASGSSVFDLLNNPSSAVTGNASSLAASIFQPVTPLSVSSTAKELREVLAPNGNFFIDPFREAQILRQAALIQTGTSFFSRTWKTQQEQEEGLYSNAIEFAKNYDLDIGQVVDEQLLANLTEPMIWYHEREVDGQLKLVPQVYLPRVSIADLHIGNGGTIVAESAEFNLDKDFSNTGNISTTGDLTVKAENIFNSVRITEHEDTANSAHTSVGGGGNIKAGALTLQASNDIRSVGGNISGSESVRLQAGNDISLESAEQISRHTQASDGVVIKTSSLVNHVTQINAGEGGLSLSAGNGVTAEGTQFNSEGSVSIHADGDINLLAVQDEEYSYSKGTKKGFGSKTTSIMEDHLITSSGASIQAAGDVLINVQRNEDGSLSTLDSGNVTLVSTDINSSGDSYLYAGEDLNVLVATNYESHHEESHTSRYGGLSSEGNVRTTTDLSLVSASLDAGGTAALLAQQDINLLAANISATDIVATAGYGAEEGSQANLNILGAQEVSTVYEHSYKKGLNIGELVESMVESAIDPLNTEIRAVEVNENSQWSTDKNFVGSTFNATNDISLNASNDINLEGASVNAANNLAVDAGNNINMLTGTNSRTDGSKSKEGFIGLAFADGGQINSEFYQGVKDESSTTTSIGSSLSAGGNVILTAGQDINVIGSSIDAGHTLSASAERDINILTGVSTSHTKHEEEEIIVGVDFSSNGNSAEVFAGVQTSRSGTENHQTLASGQFANDANVAQAGSRLSGTNVLLDAGGDITTVGSDLLAFGIQGAPEGTTGNLVLDAEGDINTLASVNANSLSSYEESLRVGVRVGVQENVSTAAESVENADGAGGAMRAVDAVQGARSGAVSASVGIITEWSRSQSEDSFGTTRASQLSASNITLNSGGDQHHQGSEVYASNNIDINAGGELLIESAENTQAHKDSYESLSLEVGLGTGSGLNLSGAAAYGNNRNNSVTHNNAHFSAGNAVNVTTGGDATFSGAVVQADSISADIGGDLIVESRQDVTHTRGESGSISASTGGNFSLGYGHTEGDSAWVQEQSGLLASNSVDVTVGGHTQLTGAVINSDSGDLLLDTQSFAYTDLHDYNNMESMDLSVGFSVGQSASANTPVGSATPTSGVNSPQGQNGIDSLGLGYSNREREQITRATIGQGTIRIRDGSNSAAGINRDLGQAQVITKDEDDSIDLYYSDKSFETVTDPAAMVDLVNPISTVGDIAASAVDGIDQLDNALNDALMLASYDDTDEDLTNDTPETRGLLNDGKVDQTAQNIQDGAGRINQTIINHVEAAVTNLPDQYQEVGQSMNATFKDYIKQGGDPDTYVELLEDEKFLELAGKLSEAQQAIKALEKEGLTSEQIADFLSSSTSNGDGSIRYLNGDEQAMDVHGTTVGIDAFQAVSELTTEAKALLKDVPLEQLGHAQLAIGVLISGPTRVGIEVAKEMGVEHLIGEHVQTASEAVSIRLAALSHGIPDEQVIQMVNVVEDPAALEAKLASGEITQEEANTYIAVADSVEMTHHGAGSATEATLMALLGIATAKVGVDVVKGGGKNSSAETDLQGPYNPNTTRADLEATHGVDNVLSSTNPNNPRQSVTSFPDKGIEVITDGNGGKAVRVKFDDPVTGQPSTANIPYNDRGLPVFDDHAKFTTNIDKTKSYDSQFSQATRDLRDGIDSGRIDSSQFTSNQLKDIRSGSSKIEDFTWHHNADSGNMQLIPFDVHDAVKHIGDGALSQGR